MAGETKTVYLPKMPVRPGQTHGYQSAHGIRVVAESPQAAAKRKAKTPSEDQVITTGRDA